MAVDFQDRVGEEVDRSGIGARFNYEIPASAELNAVCGVMAEVVCRETGAFVAFADVNRPPPAIGIEFRPAMIDVNAAFIPFGRYDRTDSETCRDSDGPAEGDEIGMEIRAIAGSYVAGVNGIAFSPARAVFHVAHAVYGVVVKGPGTAQIAIFALNDLGGDGAECKP